MKFVAILAVTLIGQTPAFCQLGQRFSVQEAQNGANTEYNVVNSSSGIGLPFNIDAFVVETTGGNPSTTNPGWSAETLDASSWLQSMGGTRPSWLDYTGKSYIQAFPNDPANVNGYVLNEPNMGGAISPDSSLNGFFFQGAPVLTDRFMLINVHGPAIVFGQEITVSGTVEVVPEPTTLSLFGIGILLLCRRMKRPNHTLEPLTTSCAVEGHRPRVPGSTRTHWSNHETRKAHSSVEKAAWRLQFRYRNPRRESAVVQLFTLGA